MSPRVSIVTPCYNAIKYLPTTWRSIQRQTFTDWEWIVWEDGSNDGSAEWLRELEARDARVRVVTGPHTGGSGPGRNRGIAVAQGELIAFVDADDIWHPRKLELQVKLLDACPKVGLTYCRIQEFWSSDYGEKDTPPPVWSRHELGKDALKNLLEKGNPAAPSTMMVRSRTLKEVGTFAEDLVALGEDFEFMTRVAAWSRVRRTPGLLAAYRMHSSNISLRNHKNFDTHDRMFEYMEKNGILKGWAGRHYRSIQHTRRAEFAMEGKAPVSPKMELVRALWYHPTKPQRWVAMVMLLIPRRQMLGAYSWLKRIQARLLPGKTPTHRMTQQWTSR